MPSITIHKSNGEKAGFFPMLLLGMVRHLGFKERPLYRGFKEEVNNDREEWRVEVLLIDTEKHNKPLIFEAYGRRSTFEAGINDAARQAIFRVRDMYADELSNTPYRYFPRRRICNTKKRTCRYNYNKHRRQHGTLLIQQIRLTKALDAVCDDALDELRETRFMLREREEELEALSGHKVVNGNDEGVVAFGGSSSAISDAVLPQSQAWGDRHRPPPGAVTAPARTRSSIVATGIIRAASRSAQSKPAPTRRAPVPCGRCPAIGSIVNQKRVSFGAASSSIISGSGGVFPGPGDGLRPPSTQLSLIMHRPAMIVEAPHRDRAPATSSSYYEGQVRGKDLVPIISEGGVGLGKEPVPMPTTPGDATTSSAPRSSERRRTTCCNAKHD